ncbi:microfibril-associated glycoprotein 4-like isoform X4 [Apostichopus japonicus]|uniref:microfibril-associated glycoprotein 4-like isoform X4 n=1 Tax=Stichopus japonicus TaxID=307972 RepID=UPI003AB79E60
MELCTSMNVKYLLFILLGVSCYRGRVVDGQVMGSFKCTPKSPSISPAVDTDSSPIDTTIPVCDDGMVKCYNGSRLGCAMLEKCVCNLTTADTIISSGGFYVNDNCTSRAHCIHGNVTWDDEYFCSSNATCEERDDVRRCYCVVGYHGDGKTCTRHTNCQDAYNAGRSENGTYIIKPTNWPGSPFPVYCNMTDGGGWTVFQRRVNGSVDFFCNWTSYKEGFGELDHEFWLGNDKLYYLTNQGRYTLRIDLVDRNGSSYFAKYDLFRINDENDNYQLSELGTFSGTAKTRSKGNDALRHHMNQQFSTHDRDNDGFGNKDCARLRHGGWWYGICCTANLNSDYNVDLITPPSKKCCGLVTSVCWRDLPGPDHNLKYTEMKIRPV